MKRSRNIGLIGLSCVVFLMMMLLTSTFPPGVLPVAAGFTPTPTPTEEPTVEPTTPPPTTPPPTTPPPTTPPPTTPPPTTEPTTPPTAEPQTPEPTPESSPTPTPPPLLPQTGAGASMAWVLWVGVCVVLITLGAAGFKRQRGH